jgi:hypothetical protein
MRSPCCTHARHCRLFRRRHHHPDVREVECCARDRRRATRLQGRLLLAAADGRRAHPRWCFRRPTLAHGGDLRVGWIVVRSRSGHVHDGIGASRRDRSARRRRGAVRRRVAYQRVLIEHHGALSDHCAGGKCRAARLRGRTARKHRPRPEERRLGRAHCPGRWPHARHQVPHRDEHRRERRRATRYGHRRDRSDSTVQRDRSRPARESHDRSGDLDELEHRGGYGRCQWPGEHTRRRSNRCVRDVGARQRKRDADGDHRAAHGARSGDIDPRVLQQPDRQPRDLVRCTRRLEAGPAHQQPVPGRASKHVPGWHAHRVREQSQRQLRHLGDGFRWLERRTADPGSRLRDGSQMESRMARASRSCASRPTPGARTSS